MFAEATSHMCKLSAICAFLFCRPTTQTPLHNCLVAIVLTKPVMAISVPKLVAMATSLRTSGLPSNTWFLGPIQVHNPNGISIGSAVLQGSLVWPSNRPPDHDTRSVTIGRIYERRTAMRPNNNKYAFYSRRNVRDSDKTKRRQCRAMHSMSIIHFADSCSAPSVSCSGNTVFPRIEAPGLY